MRNLRFSLRSAVLAGMGLAFLVPAFAQQEGPMQPVERQMPAPPDAPAPPVTTPPPPAAAGTASNPSAPTSGAPAPAAPAGATPSAPKPGATVEVPSGTSIPLVLHNGISTHSAKVGDPVYFETLFPIMIAGRVVIPAGSYVSGEVTETKRAGRVKGRAELMIKLNTLILTNGYMVNLNAVPRSAGTGGGEKVDNEGKVVGDSDKAGRCRHSCEDHGCRSGNRRSCYSRRQGCGNRSRRRSGRRADGSAAHARPGRRIAARHHC